MVDFGRSVVPVPPIAPDFKLCDGWFGTNIGYFDCFRLMSMMREGRDLVDYVILNSGGPTSVHPSPPSNSLPFVQQYC